MVSYILEDDCLTPERTLRIDYHGLQPFKFYSQIVMLLRDILEIRTMHVWQREFRWDYSGEPIKFFYRVVCQKGYDANTKAFFELVFQGTHPTDPKKEGDLVIFITSKLKTELPSNTIWQRSPMYKSLRWLYLRTFYNNARRILLNKCIHSTERIVAELQKVMGITPPKEL